MLDINRLPTPDKKQAQDNVLTIKSGEWYFLKGANNNDLKFLITEEENNEKLYISSSQSNNDSGVIGSEIRDDLAAAIIYADKKRETKAVDLAYIHINSNGCINAYLYDLKKDINSISLTVSLIGQLDWAYSYFRSILSLLTYTPVEPGKAPIYHEPVYHLGCVTENFDKKVLEEEYQKKAMSISLLGNLGNLDIKSKYRNDCVKMVLDSRIKFRDGTECDLDIRIMQNKQHTLTFQNGILQ